MDVTELHKLIDDWASRQPQITISGTQTETVAEKPPRDDGKRVVRTKSTGDRVYVIDDSAKTKAWVTSPEILEKLGFTMADVNDVEDSSLLGYNMAPSVYKVD